MEETPAAASATGAPGSARLRRPRSRLGLGAAMAVYQCVFVVGFLAYLPVLLWRSVFDRRYRQGFGQRMGQVAIARTGGDVVWIHGVSVGEIKAAANIIARLRDSRPDLQIVLSATTPNGRQVAQQEHRDLTVVFYPLDFGPFPGRALDRIRPRCVLLMELEIWPNFLQAAERRQIPVAVINGRISERTFHGYRRARGLLPQLDLIHTYCVQDIAYRQRLIDLGVDSARVFVTGNMKYDSVVMGQHREAAVGLRRWLAAEGQLVLVAGSTHADEEARLCDAVAGAAAAARCRVRLVLVPRRPERAGAVCDAVRATGREPVRWSEALGTRALGARDVLVVDTIGQLQRFYGAADVAFVGGSLVPHGGQNMLEPAAQGRAVVFGPHISNFRTDVDLLLRDLFADTELREDLGRRASQVITENQGATMRTLERIAPLLGAPLLGSTVTPPGPALREPAINRSATEGPVSGA
jgi:3-deoxy-D-manno-octulosonic-acid transferase